MTSLHYILVTELESSTETICKIKNLRAPDWKYLEDYFLMYRIPSQRLKNDLYKIDVPGPQLLSKLSDGYLNYRIVGQSMAFEHIHIDGSIRKIQKIVWTLAVTT